MRDSPFYGQTLTTNVTWLCLPNQNGELIWSDSWAFCRPRQIIIFPGKSINESSFRCSLLALYDSDFLKKEYSFIYTKKVTVTIVKLKERYKYQQWTKIQEKEEFYNSNAQILHQIINFTLRKNLWISCVLILLQLWYILILSYINW